MLPNTSERVPRHTPASLNRAIRSRIDQTVRQHAAHPERIDERLAELDREWDIERTLEANAATLAFTGVVLGAAVDKLARAPGLGDCLSVSACSSEVVPTCPRAAQAWVSHHAGDRY
jgi:hypothetical protein